MNEKFPVTSKRTGFKKSARRQRVYKASRALNRLNDAAGDIITHVENIETNQTTTGNTVAFLDIHLFCGNDVTGTNGKDLSKIFLGTTSLAATSALAQLVKLKKEVFLISADICFYFAEAGANNCLVDLYECICVKDSSVGEYGANFSAMTIEAAVS